MAGNQFTEQMRKMMPQWMKMAKDPTSVGAQFLNIFGLEFEDVEQYLNEVLSNQYIDTADIGQIDIAYKVPLAIPVVVDMEYIDTVMVHKGEDSYVFLNVPSIRKFYMAGNDENVAIIDREEGVLYLRPGSYLINDDNLFNPFDYIEVNGTAHFDYALHHIWNAFDEFGLILGLDRLFGERNEAYKKRLLDVFRNPGNSTKSGLKNALARELGLSTDSIMVNEFANPAFRENLLNSDGSPSKKLSKYVEQVNKILGFAWDNMSWGEAYWHSIEEKNIGLEYLPHVWDATTNGWKDTDFQSGIGDGNDLLVRAPKEENNERHYKYYVGLRGRKSGTDLLNPEISFKYKIVAKGKIVNEEYKPQPYRYTIVAAEIVNLYFIIRAYKEHWKTTLVDFNPSTPGYIPDNESAVEIVDGTTIMTEPTDRYLKIKVDMATVSVTDSPIIDKLHIKWKDSSDVNNTFTLDTQDDFTRNDATVDTNMTGIDITTGGAIELGYGDFYNKIDTHGSWIEGEESAQRINIEYLREGSIQLKLPKF